MGNAASGETEPARLKEELAGMHRSLQALNARCRPPSVLRPGQISVDNVIISTREDVKVALGPVVGKVEFQRARVLLEVTRTAIVTAHVSTLDAATNSMVEVPQYRSSVNCEADRPVVFLLDRLVPGKHYTITFGGICQEDVETKRASFQTQSLEHGDKLNIVVVSGDNVYDLESGEASLWRDVRDRVEQHETQFVLHLGGQVAMGPMFDKAVRLLLLHSEGVTNDTTMKQEHWPMMESKAMEILRSAYRSQWTLASNLQFVLANTSNLMIWNDSDIYPRFTTRDEFYIDHEQPTIRMQVIRTVTRCARRLYHEYQRQLWDDDFKQLVDRESEMLAIAEKALAFTAQISMLSIQIPKVVEDLELHKKRHEVEGARRIEKNLRALETEKANLSNQLVSYKQLLAPQRGEEFVFELGSIGVLVLDLRSSRLEPGGSQARENELLSNVQWRFIEETLEHTTIQLLLVCSEAPLIDDMALRESNVISSEIETSWSANSSAQARLLSELFDWKLRQPNRKFIVLGGANPVRCFARMRVKDTKLRTEAEQLTVGAMSAIPHGSVIPERSELLHDRFEVKHIEEIVNKKCFLELKLESGQNNIVEANRVGKDQQRDKLSKVRLGPVVGWVDEWCAVILLEVDRDADIVCFVENPLTKESRRVFQRFVADQANSFFLTHLRSGHYYRVSFENIQHSEQFQASFNTVANIPQQFDVVALCNESKPLRVLEMLNEDKEPHLWHKIAANTVEMPFVGLNLTLHLGGQFFPDSDVYIHEALVYASNNVTLTDLSDSEDPTTAIIFSRFREMYRATWNAPGVRESLAHGAHLMLTNENDQLPVNNQDGEDQYNVSVRSLLSRFHVRYQNLLLPPSKRLRDDEVRWRKPLSHNFGAFGFFVFPIQELGGSCLHEFTWDALRILLATPKLSTLLLVSTEALIEESLENIREKASMDTRYRNKFGFYPQDVERLLELLFSWQRDNSTSQVKKQVVLLSGSRYQSFESVVHEVYDSENLRTSTSFPNIPTADSRSLHQYVVGPLQASNYSLRPRALSTQGTLLGRYTYHHSFVRKVSSITQEEIVPALNTTETSSGSSQVMSQLIHLLLAISDKNQADASEIKLTERLVSYGICSFVSQNRIESDTKSASHSAETQVRCCHVDNWQLSTVLPLWLRELLAQTPTENEEKQVNERMTYLQERESEIRATFLQNPNLVDGLVTLSGAKQYVAELSDSFKAAHRVGANDFREHFPVAPSRFIVAFTLQQLQTVEPPNQQLVPVGAIELEQYARIFQHSFINTWLFNERLHHFWR